MTNVKIPEGNILAYKCLYIIENTLRELIIETLQAHAGPTWYKSRLPPDVFAKYKEARKAERSIPWRQLTPHHPLYYVDFPDLKKTIDQENNWRDCFARYFRRKDIFVATLSELEPIRNRIAHCRNPSAYDIQLVELAYQKLVDSGLPPT